MYVHVFVSMHCLQICQSEFLGGKHFPSVLAQVMTNQFLQVGQCMYVSVLHVSAGIMSVSACIC